MVTKIFKMIIEFVKIFIFLFESVSSFAFWSLFIIMNTCLFADTTIDNTTVLPNMKYMKNEIVDTVNNNLKNKVQSNLYDEYIFKKKTKIIAERVLHKAAILPLIGQIYNWRVLKIEDFKKTLIFSLIFSGLIGFYIYNFAMYANPSNSAQTVNMNYYKRKTYTLSFIIITAVVSFFDSYLTVYRKAANFSNDLNCYKMEVFD